MTFAEALKRWVRARTLAGENPSLLLKDHSRYEPLCVQRMKDLDTAWEELNSFPDEEVNEAMKAFRIAESDKGCSGCWFSSMRDNNHPECEMKIKRWFDARKKLAASGQ